MEVSKYLGVWFDRGMKGSFHLEKMCERSGKWEGGKNWWHV